MNKEGFGGERDSGGHCPPLIRAHKKGHTVHEKQQMTKKILRNGGNNLQQLFYPEPKIIITSNDRLEHLFNHGDIFHETTQRRK